MNGNDQIKIFVSMHKDFYVPKCKLLYPVQVGTYFSDERFVGVLHDDVGDNISNKNRSYCELTAQYWVWKNVDAEYYGFYHYRRYFSFNPADIPNNNTLIEYEFLNDSNQKAILLDDELMSKIIPQYDLIIPVEDDFFSSDTVYQHWKKHLNIDDLDLAVKVLLRLYPEFHSSVKRVLNSDKAIHCNMFIMNREIFHQYSKWLFDILFEVEKLADHSAYNEEMFRTMGHLGERLCAIYCDYLMNTQKDLKVLKLLRTLVKNNEKEIAVNPAFENGVPVVLSCNNAFSPYLTVFIQSLLKNSSADRNYDIIVLHTNISNKSQNLTKELVREYNNVSLRFINVGRNIDGFENLFISNHIKIETYYRFLMLDIMQAYPKVIYIDADTVLVDDIAKLFDTNIEGYYLAAASDCEMVAMYNLWPTTKEYVDNNLHLRDPSKYFQAGVLLFNIHEISKHFTTLDLLNAAKNYNYWYHDQDILNMFCQDKVFFLDMSWNTLSDNNGRLNRVVANAPSYMATDYLEARKAPKVIHFAGDVKPWHDVHSDFADYFWMYAQDTPVYEYLFHAVNYKLLEDLKKSRKVFFKPFVSENPTVCDIYQPKKTRHMIDTFREHLNKGVDNHISVMLPKGTKRHAFVRKIIRRGN